MQVEEGAIDRYIYIWREGGGASRSESTGTAVQQGALIGDVRGGRPRRMRSRVAMERPARTGHTHTHTRRGETVHSEQSIRSGGGDGRPTTTGAEMRGRARAQGRVSVSVYVGGGRGEGEEKALDQWLPR